MRDRRGDAPNIVVILTDQQRHDTIAAAGNPIIKTPSLDRLAREGTLFRHAFTPSPVCIPARWSLLSGRYPHHTGCFSLDDPMPDDQPTVADALTEAGYRTHAIGKMHFVPDPLARRGFERRERQEVGALQKVEDDDYVSFLHAHGYAHVHDPYGPLGDMFYVPQPAQMPAALHGTQWVGDRAVSFIEQSGMDRSFFLFASFFHPHPPFSPPTPWNKLYRAALMPLPKRPADFETLQTYGSRIHTRGMYRDHGTDDNLLRTMRAYYYACISFVDLQVGRILDTLAATGRLDATLVLFTSDHGEFLGDYGAVGKCAMLDPAARVPLIVRYPPRFGAPGVCDLPVSLVDVVPTLLAAAGVDDPRFADDGVDLASLIVGADRDPDRDRTVYSQYQHGPLGHYMAVNRRWKYTYSAPDRREFLFDRLHDPDETRSRAGVGPSRPVLNRQRAGLLSFFRDQGYTEPIDGDSWRLFPQPTFPLDPDAGLGVHDVAWTLPYLPIPGYSDD